MMVCTSVSLRLPKVGKRAASTARGDVLTLTRAGISELLVPLIVVTLSSRIGNNCRCVPASLRGLVKVTVTGGCPGAVGGSGTGTTMLIRLNRELIPGGRRIC